MCRDVRRVLRALETIGAWRKNGEYYCTCVACAVGNERTFLTRKDVGRQVNIWSKFTTLVYKSLGAETTRPCHPALISTAECTSRVLTSVYHTS